MEEEQINIREFLKRYNRGDFDSSNVKTQIAAGWYDWFCEDRLLKRKTDSLVRNLKSIVNSPKINKDTMYVWFKNNCPMQGSLYDDFRIANMKTGDVLYTITPKDSHHDEWSTVFGKKNDFERPLVVRKWDAVKNFFFS